MNETDFKAKAKALMTKHGVGYLPLEMDGGKNRLGACFTRKVHNADMRLVTIPVKLSFSRHYVALMEWDELEKTVLHEIAHALTPGHKHDMVWKAKARELGLTGDRCATPTVRPAGTVEFKCPTCSKVYGTAHRLPLRVYICSVCKPGGKSTPLSIIKNGYRVSIYDMPTRYRAEFRSALNRGKMLDL